MPDIELSTLHALFNHHNNLQNPLRITLAQRFDIIYSTHTIDKGRSRIQTKASFQSPLPPLPQGHPFIHPSICPFINCSFDRQTYVSHPLRSALTARFLGVSHRLTGIEMCTSHWLHVLGWCKSHCGSKG